MLKVMKWAFQHYNPIKVRKSLKLSAAIEIQRCFVGAMAVLLVLF